MDHMVFDTKVLPESSWSDGGAPKYILFGLSFNTGTSPTIQPSTNKVPFKLFLSLVNYGKYNPLASLERIWQQSFTGYFCEDVKLYLYFDDPFFNNFFECAVLDRGCRYCYHTQVCKD